MLVNYRSEEEIAREIWVKMTHEDISEIEKIPTRLGMIEFHHTTGRWIRNKYRLWQRGHTPEIKGGIDVSEQHPDAISMRILMLIWDRVHE